MSRFTAIAIAALLVCAVCNGCSHRAAPRHARATHHHHEHEHKHKSSHGGSLNAVVTCENGHAEAKLDGDKLQLWFVGGGHDTDRSVRIPDGSIRLRVDTGGGVKTLVLSSKPLDLAGEKVGDCSHFVGAAPWLKGLTKFAADGQITFRGQKTPLRIEYPEGYDPD